jgi:hypothetical protein
MQMRLCRATRKHVAPEAATFLQYFASYFAQNVRCNMAVLPSKGRFYDLLDLRHAAERGYNYFAAQAAD